MDQITSQFYGNHPTASDGEIGKIKDFYFDDFRWVIRYVVVVTGSSLTGRQVLLSRHAFEPGDPTLKGWRVQVDGKALLDPLSRLDRNSDNVMDELFLAPNSEDPPLPPER